MSPGPTTTPAEPTGRFAPSPSGALHFGSVTAALASFLDVRSRGGRWLLRIDDLDPPRERPGAAAQILATLEALGLHWDGEPVYQSQRGPAYEQALATLAADGWTYPCGCSRSEIGERPYPGTCRDGIPAGRRARSLRVRVGNATITLDDRIQGHFEQNLGTDCGDFVVRRADGLTAYHLAVVVDDAAAGVTEIVRGADLLASTPLQIHLTQCLGLAQPSYAHLPVVLDDQGLKLSKHTGASAVTARTAPLALFHALLFLGLDPPADLNGAPVGDLLGWALPLWRLDLPGLVARPYSAFAAANMARNSA